MPVVIERETAPGEFRVLARGRTDDDGRAKSLLVPGSLTAGVYRVTFDTATYFQSIGVSSYFYPSCSILCCIDDVNQHYHVPLLISPFGYSTYRGS